MNVRPLGLDGGSIRELTDEEIADLMQGMSASKGELFHYSWHNGPRASIDGGCIPCDGQQLSQLMYPDVYADVIAGKQFVVSEADWLADSLKRNVWSTGGMGWVRVPDLNGVTVGASAFYLRGSPAALGGQGVGDAIRNIVGELPAMMGNNGAQFFAENDGSGALRIRRGSGNQLAQNVASSLSKYVVGTYFDASLSVPTAAENRPKSAYGVWCVRVATEVINKGAVDVLQLATQVGALTQRVEAVEQAATSTYVYFGGTEAAPVNLAANSHIRAANPFPGKPVAVRLELRYGGEWMEPGSYSNNTAAVGAYGRYKYPTDEVFAIGAVNGLMPRPNLGCNLGTNSVDVTAPTPVRLLVWII